MITQKMKKKKKPKSKHKGLVVFQAVIIIKNIAYGYSDFLGSEREVHNSYW